MSIRTMALPSSNRNSARLLVSSVLPTPVGPRNRNEPSAGSDPGGRRGRGGWRGHGGDGGLLADHPAADHLLHLQQLLALAFQHLVDRMPVQRETTPAISSGVTSSRSMAVWLALFRFGDLPFELRDRAVGNLPGLREVARALRLVEFEPRGVELLLELALRLHLVALALPAPGQLRRLLLKISEFLFQRGEPVPGRAVGFALQRFALDLELDDAPVERLDLLRLRLHLHAQREAASSIRSIALSGRKRSVM
jgi:hypothetical protein